MSASTTHGTHRSEGERRHPSVDGVRSAVATGRPVVGRTRVGRAVRWTRAGTPRGRRRRGTTVRRAGGSPSPVSGSDPGSRSVWRRLIGRPDSCRASRHVTAPPPVRRSGKTAHDPDRGLHGANVATRSSIPACPYRASGASSVAPSSSDLPPPPPPATPPPPPPPALPPPGPAPGPASAGASATSSPRWSVGLVASVIGAALVLGAQPNDPHQLIVLLVAQNVADHRLAGRGGPAQGRRVAPGPTSASRCARRGRLVRRRALVLRRGRSPAGVADPDSAPPRGVTARPPSRTSSGSPTGRTAGDPADHPGDRRCSRRSPRSCCSGGSCCGACCARSTPDVAVFVSAVDLRAGPRAGRPVGRHADRAAGDHPARPGVGLPGGADGRALALDPAAHGLQHAQRGAPVRLRTFRRVSTDSGRRRGPLSRSALKVLGRACRTRAGLRAGRFRCTVHGVRRRRWSRSACRSPSASVTFRRCGRCEAQIVGDGRRPGPAGARPRPRPTRSAPTRVAPRRATRPAR